MSLFAATSTNLFASQTTAATQPTPSTGFTFGPQQPSLSSGLPAFGSLTQPTQTSTLQTSTAFPAFGTQTTTSLPAFGASLTLPGQQVVQPLGLLPQQQLQLQQQPVARGLGGEGATAGENANANKSAKDTTILPTEWLPLVESFKKFVKDQKTIKEENVQPRFSVEPIQEISTELSEGLRSQLQRLDITLQKNAKSVEILKKETTALICDAETCYRAIKSEGFASSSYNLQQNQYMTPSSHVYFVKLLEEFERQMTTYSTQIKELEMHLENINKPHVPQELLTIIRKQHDTLVALAAEIYLIHEEVNKQATANMAKLGHMSADKSPHASMETSSVAEVNSIAASQPVTQSQPTVTVSDRFVTTTAAQTPQVPQQTVFPGLFGPPTQTPITTALGALSTTPKSKRWPSS